MSELPSPEALTIDDIVLNLADAPERGGDEDAPWAGRWRVLTPNMRRAGGRLGVVQNTLPPGSAGCPFHWHAREDEVFLVLSGRGVLRYAVEIAEGAGSPASVVREVGPGDCIACPAGTRQAHQIANPFDEELVYLAIGPYDPDEVCGYPDSGKLLVRAARTTGTFEPEDYMHGEPTEPAIFAQWAQASTSEEV